MATHCHSELSSRSNATGLAKDISHPIRLYHFQPLFIMSYTFISSDTYGIVGLLCLSNNGSMFRVSGFLS